jgi:hypothetical protein
VRAQGTYLLVRFVTPIRESGGSALYGEESPDARYTLQFVLATVLELDARARDEVLDSARDQHFSRTGECSHPRTNVDRDSTNVIASGLHFACVKANADIHSDPSGTITDCKAALYCSTRSVECGKETVAHRFDESATVSVGALVRHFVMAI